MIKRRPEWRVRLYLSNYKDVKGTYARIVPNGNVSLDDLAERLEERSGIYKADFTRAIPSAMTKMVEDCLLEGKSVSGELGMLMPALSGEVCRFFPREEVLLNSRGVISGESPVSYRIYPEGEEYVIIEEGKKIV